jgi:hypothetical protein
MYLSYSNIPGPKDPLVARFSLPMLSDVGRHDPTRIIFTTGLCLLSAVYVVIILIADRLLWLRINRMSSAAVAVTSPLQLQTVADRARWLGIFSVALLALTALIPNTYSLMGHNTVAAVHFITSAIWGLMFVQVLERTSLSSDPVIEANLRRGIKFKKWAVWTNLASSFMVVALFGVFKSLDAEDDHRQSDIMDASPALQWLRWVAWPLFEYVVVMCENLFTMSLYHDFAGLDVNFSVSVLPAKSQHVAASTHSTLVHPDEDKAN